MLTLRFSKQADKALIKMPNGIALKMVAELNSIAASPHTYRGDWKPLQGMKNIWRLRVGDWRALCELNNGELILLVIKISSRGNIYL